MGQMDAPLRIYRPAPPWKQPLVWVAAFLLAVASSHVLNNSSEAPLPEIAYASVFTVIALYICLHCRFEVYSDHVIYQNWRHRKRFDSGAFSFMAHRSVMWPIQSIGPINGSYSIVEFYGNPSFASCLEKLGSGQNLTSDDVNDDVVRARAEKQVHEAGEPLRVFGSAWMTGYALMFLLLPFLLYQVVRVLVGHGNELALVSGAAIFFILWRTVHRGSCTVTSTAIIVRYGNAMPEIITKGDFFVLFPLRFPILSVGVHTKSGHDLCLRGPFEEEKLIYTCLKKLEAGEELTLNDVYAHPVEIPR